MALYDALIAKWADRPMDATIGDQMGWINSLTVPGDTYNDLDMQTFETTAIVIGADAAVRGFVAGNPSGQDAVLAAAKMLTALADAPSIYTLSLSQYSTQIVGAIDALVAASVLTADQKTAMLAQAVNQVPWVTAPVDKGGAGLPDIVTMDTLVAAGLVVE